MPVKNPWTRIASELLSELHSDRKQGLNLKQVQQSRMEHGLNQLAEAPPTPLWLKLVRQFNDVMIWLLFVAAIIAGAMGGDRRLHRHSGHRDSQWRHQFPAGGPRRAFAGGSKKDVFTSRPGSTGRSCSRCKCQ